MNKLKTGTDIFFTIITVCYNVENEIEKTICSVLNQTYMNYEYIIQDGESKDHSIEILNQMITNNPKVYLKSQKDSGIYDAMNRALDCAKGDYVFFLNAGDCFFDSQTLCEINSFLKMKPVVDVLYGNVIYKDSQKRYIRSYGNMARKKFSFLMGDCICHQAMFAKRSMFLEKKFDLKYHVCADREWQLYFLTNKYCFIPMNLIIATVLIDGFSKEHVDEFEQETLECLKQYYPDGVWIHKIVMKLKKNRNAIKLLRILEKLFLQKKDK